MLGYGKAVSAFSDGQMRITYMVQCNKDIDLLHHFIDFVIALSLYGLASNLSMRGRVHGKMYSRKSPTPKAMGCHQIAADAL